MKKLAVLGLGLMGGSLCLAARRRGLARTVVAYARREQTRAEATGGGFVDAIHGDPAAAVRGADVVVLCVPILAMAGLVDRVREALDPGAVVTDVGSTKAELSHVLSGKLSTTQAVFIGSHPIAGSEETGLEAAREDLYEEAVTVLTPDGDLTDPTYACALDTLSGLWRGAGSRVLTMGSQLHDRIIARTSHLPHLAAALLVKSALRGEEHEDALCGTGFRDTTRIAAGSAEMWHDIVKTNKDALLLELAGFGEHLSALRHMLENDDYPGVLGLLDECRQLRRSRLPGYPGQ